MAAHARAVPSYVLKALALAHPDDPNVLDNEQVWQRAHLPEGFTDSSTPRAESDRLSSRWLSHRNLGQPLRHPVVERHHRL
jgi:hypothetical protein